MKEELFIDKTAFELLIAVLLSAQCTDAQVNKVTPALFQAYPTPEAMAAASPDAIKHLINAINYNTTKARHCQETATHLVERFNSTVPDTLEQLVTLPGVGRKTANVILSQWFRKPGIAVDTHVARVSRRLGFHDKVNPTDIEMALKKTWPIQQWSDACTVLILHGRQVCHARNPKCDACFLNTHCPKLGVC